MVYGYVLHRLYVLYIHHNRMDLSIYFFFVFVYVLCIVSTPRRYSAVSDRNQTGLFVTESYQILLRSAPRPHSRNQLLR